jgi:hypothetical protein
MREPALLLRLPADIADIGQQVAVEHFRVSDESERAIPQQEFAAVERDCDRRGNERSVC